MNQETNGSSYGRELEFHCPKNHDLKNLDDCEMKCKNMMGCDIYATMLNDIYKK